MLTTDQIRREARRRHLSARQLSRLSGVAVASCHKVLSSQPGEAVLREDSLAKLSRVFEEWNARAKKEQAR